MSDAAIGQSSSQAQGYEQKQMEGAAIASGGVDPSSGQVVSHTLVREHIERLEVITLKNEIAKVKGEIQQAKTQGKTEEHNALEAKYEQLSTKLANKEAAIAARQEVGSSSIEQVESSPIDKAISLGADSHSQQLSIGHSSDHSYISGDGQVDAAGANLVVPEHIMQAAASGNNWFSSGFVVALAKVMDEYVRAMQEAKRTDTEMSVAFQMAERTDVLIAREMGYDSADSIRSEAQKQLIGAFVKAGISLGFSVAASGFTASRASRADPGITAIHAQTINSAGQAGSGVGGAIMDYQAAQDRARQKEQETDQQYFSSSADSNRSASQAASKSREETQQAVNDIIRMIQDIMHANSQAFAYSHVSNGS